MSISKDNGETLKQQTGTVFNFFNILRCLLLSFEATFFCLSKLHSFLFYVALLSSSGQSDPAVADQKKPEIRHCGRRGGGQMRFLVIERGSEASLRFEKLDNIDSFRGYIEIFSLFSNRSEARGENGFPKLLGVAGKNLFWVCLITNRRTKCHKKEIFQKASHLFS